MFADIEPDHFCLDADSVRAAVTDRTAAVMPVHLYGHPADMDAYRALADEHGIRVFEDAAQAHPAPRGAGAGRLRSASSRCSASTRPRT